MVRWLKWLCLVIYLPFVASSAAPSAYFVAPYGVASNDGSADAPRTLAWAMSSAPAGSTVWLVPGTYTGAWVANAPGVTYRSEVGTRARLDGNLTIQAADTTFRDLEITNTSWLTRTGTTMPAINTYVGVFAPRVKLLNSWVHDLGGGIYAFNGSGGASADLVARGNLIYNNGWQDTANPRSAHGHNLYAQNDDAGRKTLSGNVLLNPYSLNVQFYGSSGPSAQLRHFDLVGNTVVNGSVLIGGGQPASDIHARDNLLWSSGLGFGYVSQANDDAEIRNNSIGHSRLQIQWWQRLIVTGNRINANDSEVVIYYPYAGGPITTTWDLNSYYQLTPTSFGMPPVTNKNFAQWKAATGFDTNSTFASAPASNWISVQPNADDSQKGVVTIYNWTNVATITLDLTTLPLTPGASYKLVNAQNPSQSLAIVAGSAVSLPTGGWTIATPYGAAAPFRANTAPQFLTFLVEPA